MRPSSGLVSSDKRAATIVEVNIQTDFSARNDAFKKFVHDVHGLAEKAHHGADLSTHSIAGKTVAEMAIELTAKIGEKIAVRRWDRVEMRPYKEDERALYKTITRQVLFSDPEIIHVKWAPLRKAIAYVFMFVGIGAAVLLSIFFLSR